MEIDPWTYPWKLTPGQTHGKMENQPPPPPAAPRGPRRDEHPEQENLNTETRQITRKAATTNIPMEIDPWTDPWKTGKANASALRPDAILLHSRQRALRARDGRARRGAPPPPPPPPAACRDRAAATRQCATKEEPPPQCAKRAPTVRLPEGTSATVRLPDSARKRPCRDRARL